MVFNNKLVEGLEGNDLAAAKLLLFCMHEGVRLNDFITHFPNESDIHWTKTVSGRIQHIVRHFIDIGVFKQSYGDDTRYILDKPLYVNEADLQDEEKDYILRCMQPFTHKYCKVSGRVPPFEYCQTIVNDFLAKYPRYRDILPEVFKLRIDRMPNYVPNWATFVNLSRNEEWIAKDLLAYCKEYEDGGVVNEKLFL